MTRTFTALQLAVALSILNPALAAPPSAVPPSAVPPSDGLAAQRARMVDDLAALRFDRLGNPVLRWDAIPPVYAPRSRPHELLVVLVRFADRGFDRFKGDARQGEKLAAFYQRRLFDPRYERPNTLSHYYRVQSLDTYHLQGRVLPPVTLSKPRADYGLPVRPEGGDWRNDRDTQGMVEETLALAVKSNPNVHWGDFDRWDPADFDGDDVRAESDGYLDHLVLIFAGGGQSACDGLFKLSDVFTPNSGMDVIDRLDPAERECAERPWPHRFVLQKREGRGPEVEGRTHARGGVELRPGLWAVDYNMQSEYTEISTFVHEFGHSIGLPDIYARTSSNSTGGWELMSSTSDPVPQNLSAWSRIQLGWLRPKVIRPPAFGGKKVASVYLRTLDDPLDPASVARANQRAGLWRAALVVLPPKLRVVELTALPAASGERALYSGQGNELNRTATLRLDLSAVKAPDAALSIVLSFDAWWEIEAGWDFTYVEASDDGGQHWKRLLPMDRQHMPAKHGHDGKHSLPGFTGISGDLDGDGKNESQADCDPKKKLAHGEDKAEAKASPCLVPSWVRPSFDLTAHAGHKVQVRLRYFTDMAAVMRGMLIDNVRVDAGGKTLLQSDFEGRTGGAWRLDGFTSSSGRHTLLVPHYYVLEYRDPYAPDAAQYRYDAGLTDPYYRFYYDPEAGGMAAVQVRPRPGVLAWYYDGAYAWSENDPANNGPGHGFLLAVDAQPNELRLPGLGRWYQGKPEAFDTRYTVRGEAAQAALSDAFYRTACFVRDPRYRPRGVDAAALAKACGDAKKAPMGQLSVGGKPLMYAYEVINDLLPGPARAAVTEAGELLDYKRREGKLSYRLRDRSLRYLHTLDAPFALEPFPDGVIYYKVKQGAGGPVLERVGSAPHPATRRFSDATPARWANPKLPFDGVKPRAEGFAFELARPGKGAPRPAKVKVWFLWDE